MGIDEHCRFFAGKPVALYDPEIGIEDPINRIYRLAIDYDSSLTMTDLLGQFLSDSNVTLIPGMIIGNWDQEAIEPIVEILVSASERLSQCKAIFIGDIIREENEISWIEQGDLSSIFLAYPQLEEFKVRGGNNLRLGLINHSHLKSLTIETGGLSQTVLDEIYHSTLPELEHLELWLGDGSYGADIEVHNLAPLLSGQLFPKLTYLGLRNSEIMDDIAEAVAVSPILDTIKVLDLSMGTLGDRGAEALLSSPKILELEKLDLHFNYISKEVVERLEQLSILVDVSDTQDPERYDDEDYRYVAVSE